MTEHDLRPHSGSCLEEVSDHGLRLLRICHMVALARSSGYLMDCAMGWNVLHMLEYTDESRRRPAFKKKDEDESKRDRNQK